MVPQSTSPANPPDCSPGRVPRAAILSHSLRALSRRDMERRRRPVFPQGLKRWQRNPPLRRGLPVACVARHWSFRRPRADSPRFARDAVPRSSSCCSRMRSSRPAGLRGANPTVAPGVADLKAREPDPVGTAEALSNSPPTPRVSLRGPAPPAETGSLSPRGVKTRGAEDGAVDRDSAEVTRPDPGEEEAGAEPATAVPPRRASVPGVPRFGGARVAKTMTRRTRASPTVAAGMRNSSPDTGPGSGSFPAPPS